jgi:hypothetical protein
MVRHEMQRQKTDEKQLRDLMQQQHDDEAIYELISRRANDNRLNETSSSNYRLVFHEISDEIYV